MPSNRKVKKIRCPHPSFSLDLHPCNVAHPQSQNGHEGKCVMNWIRSGQREAALLKRTLWTISESSSDDGELVLKVRGGVLRGSHGNTSLTVVHFWNLNINYILHHTLCSVSIVSTLLIGTIRWFNLFFGLTFIMSFIFRKFSILPKVTEIVKLKLQCLTLGLQSSQCLVFLSA